MTSPGQMSVSESSSRTTANSNIRQYGCSQIGLAFRTDSTAPPQACTLIGAVVMPEIMPDRQNTMRAEAIGAGASAPDVRQGALGGRRARLDVVTSGSGSGRAYPARPKNSKQTQGRVDTKDFVSWYTLQ